MIKSCRFFIRKVFVEEIGDLCNIFLHHGSQSLNVGFFCNFVELLDSSHSLVSAKTAEVDLKREDK